MKTYTIKEFLHKDDKKGSVMAMIAAAIITPSRIAYADEIGDKINGAGNTAVYYIRFCGRWFFIAICFIECIKAVLGKRPSDIPSILIKYGLGYGCFCLVVGVFDLIDKVLS